MPKLFFISVRLCVRMTRRMKLDKAKRVYRILLVAFCSSAYLHEKRLCRYVLGKVMTVMFILMKNYESHEISTCIIVKSGLGSSETIAKCAMQ